jgi:isopenicillin-N epimerase
MPYNCLMRSLRKSFLLDPKVHFLNHASFGATPRPVFREYERWQRQLENQPVEFLGRRHDGLMRAARRALGNFLHTDADNLVFTQNVTISLNIVARSLELGPGDEVLSTDHEYGAMDRLWRFLSGERGFTYVKSPIPVPLVSVEKFVDDFWKGVTPRTRVIFLSHITSPTAIIFPVKQIVERARTAGILSIVDGAHVAGQLPLDLEALGADFYGGNLHKWLCAPKGAGFLYARPQAQPLLKPLVVSWGYESETPSGSAFVDHNEWWGTRDIAAFLSVPAAIQYQAAHDWDEVRRACHGLAAAALRGIENLTGRDSFYPDEGWYAQMFTAVLPDSLDIRDLKTSLYDRYRIEVPCMEWNGRKLIRVSIQGYNTPGDVDALLRALQHQL